MKLSIVMMAFLGAQAISLKDQPDEFFASEQKWSEYQASQKEVKAAKDAVELDQLKADTKRDLADAQKFNEIARISEKTTALHQAHLNEDGETPKEKAYQRSYLREHGFAPSSFSISYDLVQTEEEQMKDDLEEARQVLLDRASRAEIQKY